MIHQLSWPNASAGCCYQVAPSTTALKFDLFDIRKVFDSLNCLSHIHGCLGQSLPTMSSIFITSRHCVYHIWLFTWSTLPCKSSLKEVYEQKWPLTFTVFIYPSSSAYDTHRTLWKQSCSVFISSVIESSRSYSTSLAITRDSIVLHNERLFLQDFTKTQPILAITKYYMQIYTF